MGLPRRRGSFPAGNKKPRRTRDASAAGYSSARLEQVEVVLELRGQEALPLEGAAGLLRASISAEDFNRLQLHEVLLGPRRIKRQRREQQERTSIRIENHRPRRL